MAKKKTNQKNLIFNIVIIALAVLTICTLFMPVFVQNTIATKEAVFTAKGLDVLKAMFASEFSLEMSGEVAALYSLRAAEETAFITTLFSWLYLITLCVSFVSLVFAVLSIVGKQFKMLNKVLGIVVMALAVLTFIFAISVAAQWTAVETLLGKEVGFKGLIQVGIYMLIATLVQGGIQFYLNRK